MAMTSLLRRLAGLALLALLPWHGQSQAQAQAQTQTQAQGEAAPDFMQSTQRWLDDAMVKMPPGGNAPLRMEVTLGALDSRLKLAPCARVEPYLPAGVRLWGKTRLGLRCLEGASRWSIFVPVTVKAFGPAWVARGPVAPGQVLTVDDGIESEVDWAEDTSPVLANPNMWIGQTASRGWAPGQAIRQVMVKPATVFQAGTQVRVVADGPGFQVMSDGQAVTAGIVGQQARVRMDNGRIMSGVVLDARTVRLEL